MTNSPFGAPHLQSVTAGLLQEPKLALGAMALLGWFVALTMTDFAYDALDIADAGASTHPATHAIYEIASGYALGFVAAIAAALLGGLLRAGNPDPAAGSAWLRPLAAVALFAVALACVSGAAVHNAAGVTLLYDLSFAAGLVAVFAGVVPLHQHLMAQERR